MRSCKREGLLRSFANEPVADIVQCGEPQRVSRERLSRLTTRLWPTCDHFASMTPWGGDATFSR